MRYLLMALIALAMTSSFSLAASMDQLAATKHNFTTGAYNLGTGNICQPCHTPHHAIVDGAISTRLWNHRLSSAEYTLYKSGPTAFTTNVDGSQGMDRVSRLCLACHDGTVALDAFGMGTTGVAGGNTGSVYFSATDTRNLGVNFKNDHPVGIDAKALNADGTPVLGSRLKAAVLTVGTSGTSATIGTLRLAKMADGFVVGCRTCHTAHGTGTVALTPIPKLLNVPEAVICTSCHYK